MIARFERRVKSAAVGAAMIGPAVLLIVFSSTVPAAAQNGAANSAPPPGSTAPTVPPRPTYSIPSDAAPRIPGAGDGQRPRPTYRWEDNAPATSPESRPKDTFAIPGTDPEFPALPAPGKPADAIPESTPDATGPVFRVPESTPKAAPDSGNYENPLDDLAFPPRENAPDAVLPAPSESLREQLRDVLQERETVIREQYIAGRASLSDLLFATDEVFRAELALRRQTDERVRLWKKYLENLQGFETQIAPYATAGAGRVTRADYLAIKAIRLKAQIGLASEPLR